VGDAACHTYLRLAAGRRGDGEVLWDDEPLSRCGAVRERLTGAPCDAEASASAEASRALRSTDLPCQSWPGAREPRWPFGKDYAEYYRALGPGVLVGRAVDGRQAAGSVPVVRGYLLLVERVPTALEEMAEASGWMRDVSDPWL